MPLQGTAKDVMRRMKQQYGKDAEKVFYATANKKGLVPETWQKKESGAMPVNEWQADIDNFTKRKPFQYNPIRSFDYNTIARSIYDTETPWLANRATAGRNAIESSIRNQNWRANKRLNGWSDLDSEVYRTYGPTGLHNWQTSRDYSKGMGGFSDWRKDYFSQNRASIAPDIKPPANLQKLKDQLSAMPKTLPTASQPKTAADLTPYDPRTWDKKQWQSAGATGGAIVGLYALYKLLKSEPEQAPYGY